MASHCSDLFSSHVRQSENIPRIICINNHNASTLQTAEMRLVVSVKNAYQPKYKKERILCCLVYAMCVCRFDFDNSLAFWVLLVPTAAVCAQWNRLPYCRSELCALIHAKQCKCWRRQVKTHRTKIHYILQKDNLDNWLETNAILPGYFTLLCYLPTEKSKNNFHRLLNWWNRRKNETKMVRM